MNKKNKFFKIYCNERTAKNRVCNCYLGDIQVDVPNTTRKYCRNCKKLIEYTAHPDNLITKEVLKPSVRLSYAESYAIVG
jgi:hypothetical protein